MAIRLRLASVGHERGDLILPIETGESLRKAAVRILGNVRLDICISETFHFLINGQFVDPKEWDIITLSSEDEVLIVPKLTGGDSNALLRTLIIVGAGFVVGPAIAGSLGFSAGVGSTALSKFAYGLTVGATTAAATALAFSAFPPPPIDLGPGSSVASSQMYSINSQSNALKKLDIVPKVYGQHKMFPPVAANPYTELVADNTGTLVQDFYCIYDFGLGPVDVTDLRIGDTPITNFSNYEINFVDPNKPAVSEGPWDDKTTKDFRIYKGDVSTESVGVAINGNRTVSGTPASEYQVQRTLPVNPENLESEITITFANPTGLVSFASNGNSGTATIDTTIEFAKVGTEDWKFYNDPAFVRNISAAGGSARTDSYKIEFSSPDIISSQDDTAFARAPYPSNYLVQLSTSSGTAPQKHNARASYRVFGIPKGRTYFIGKDIGINPAGFLVLIGGKRVGKILSRSFLGNDFYGAPLWTYELETPTTEDIPIFRTVRIRYNISNVVEIEPNQSLAAFADGQRNVLGNFRIQNNSPEVVYSTVKFTPIDVGQYKIRINREATASQFTFRTQSDLTVVDIKTRLNVAPIITNKRHTFLELRIRATNQINGAIQNLSGIATSILEVWNGTAWVKQETSNPAWIFADILTGNINKRAIPKSRLHLPSIIEWAEFCDEIPVNIDPNFTFQFPRFSSNFVMDYATTVQELVQQVCSSYQASLSLIDGKYGVLLDKLRTVPVQIFTPRNSKGFSSTKVFGRKPHGLIIRYVDPANNWQLSETTVYADGYDEETATIFEELNTFGVIAYEQALRYGRYQLAQMKLRQEVINLEVDFEYLVCSRGDYVRITQDVMRVGGNPARVISVTGNQIVIDDGIETDPLLNYGYTFRNKNGIFEGTVAVDSADTFTLTGPLPAKGDLIIIGPVTTLYYDCIVKSINPISDLRAGLTLIEKADQIYEAETGVVLSPYNPGISITNSDDFSPPPAVQNLVVADNFYECQGSGYRYFIVIDWDVPVGSAFDSFEVYVNFGQGFDLVTTTKSSVYDYTVLPANLGKAHEFKVVAQSATGRKLDLGSVGSVVATPLAKTARPNNVESLSIDITNEVLTLSWPAVTDCDLREYLIRYSPVTTDNWETSIPLTRADRNTLSASTQARTGVYLIKSVDFAFNESEIAAVAVTTIPNLFNLNVIEETNDFPTLAGVLERVVNDGATLRLDSQTVGGPGVVEYYQDGYYYYESFLDLGEIYTVRLQSKIRAEGFTLDGLMSSWVTLADVASLFPAGTSEWDVETQYRTTDQFNVMADWATLADIDPISEGNQDNWTEWKKFTIGDATGRIFQFRLRLISNVPSVSPRVFDGVISADMPDRIESGNNLTVPVSGLSVTYSPAFKGPLPSPSVQITIEDAASGDYPEFVVKNVDGFTVVIKDSSGNPVERVIDYQAKGFGRKNTSVI